MEALTVKEISKKLNCSAEKVNKLIKEGRLNGEKINKKWKINPLSVDNFLKVNGSFKKDINPINKIATDKEIKELFKNESIDNTKNIPWVNRQGIYIDWKTVIDKATERFYKEATLESAKYLSEVQRFYKRDDTNGYLAFLEEHENG